MSINNGSPLVRYIVSFCVITTGVGLLEGILGGAFMPEMRFGFEAYYVPPLYGFLTVLTGLVLESRRTLSLGEMLFRMTIQLVLIECIVFGTNHLSGNFYTLAQSLVLAAGIAAVFISVHFIIWLNERRIASLFNKKLAEMQKSIERGAIENN